MSFLAGVRWVGLSGGLLLGAWGGVSRAGEPTPPAAKMPAWVVVKAGTAVSESPRPIEPTSFAVTVGTIAPRTRVPIDLEVRNTSAAPIRIVGANRGCSPQGCITTRGQYPLVIPPGQTGTMRVEYIAPSEGRMPADRHLQLEADFFIGAATTFAVTYRVTADIAPDAGAKTDPKP